MSELTDTSPAERHRMLAARFFAVAEQVSDWSAPTPVKEWVAADIVEHLGWLPGMLGGMGVDVPPIEGDSPLDRLRAQTAVVQAMLEGPHSEQIVETGFMGAIPLSAVIERFYSFDLFGHTWDLARSSGQDADLDADYAAGAFAGMSAMGPALHESGQFGTPQPVADDATVQDKLIALIGRDPAWSA